MQNQSAALAAATALVAIVVGIGPAFGSTEKQATMGASCAAGSVQAVIAGKRVCLRRGQRCSKQLDRQYHRYKFHCHGGRLTGGPPAPVPSAGRIVARLAVSSAGGIAFGAGAVWIASNAAHTITRVDPGTNKIVGTVSLGDPALDPLHGPTLLAFDHGSLWILNGALDCSCVQRVDPLTNRVVATIPLGTPTQFRVAPLGIATTPDAVWVSNRWGTEDAPAGSVVRIDPTTNRIVATVGLGASFEGNAGPTGIAADSQTVWVGVPSMKSVVRIDARTNTVAATIPGFTCVEGQLASDESGVWVADCDAVRYVSAETNAIERRIVIAQQAKGAVVGLAAVGVGIGYGSVWIQAGRLLKVDPKTGSVAGSSALPDALGIWTEYNLAFGFGSVWVRRIDSVLRIDPA